MIQVNGKWGTDNSLNLTTFAGFGPKTAQSLVICPTNCGRIIEVNDIGEKCDIFDKKCKKNCENFDEIIDLKTRKTQYAKSGKSKGRIFSPKKLKKVDQFFPGGAFWSRSGRNLRHKTVQGLIFTDLG